jgi:hypothetical protein
MVFRVDIGTPEAPDSRTSGHESLVRDCAVPGWDVSFLYVVEMPSPMREELPDRNWG